MRIIRRVFRFARRYFLPWLGAWFVGGIVLETIGELWIK
jgi:hypothetical protein